MVREKYSLMAKARKRVNGERKIQLDKKEKKKSVWREKNTARQGKNEKERIE